MPTLENRYHRIIDAVPDLVSFVDREHRYRFVNDEYKERFGVDPADIIGRHMSEVAGKEAYAVTKPYLEEALKGKRVRFENRFADKRGSWRSVEVEAVPSRVGDEVEGVIFLGHDITERKRAEAELEEREAQFRFLSEASRLLASSLDPERVLVTLAQLAVPDIADWCAIDMLDERGNVKLVSVAHVNPKKIEWAKELRAMFPSNPDAPYGVPKVIRTGTAELYANLSPDDLKRSVTDPRRMKVIEELALTSVMIVPLTARGATFGAVSLISAESGIRYTEDDVKFAENLAGRAALAVDNARLYKLSEDRAAELREEISRHKQLQEKYYQLAYYDSLTGLPNRDLMQARLKQAIADAKRTDRYVGVMFVDLDGFKQINDTHGHQVGDTLLAEVGGRLRAAVRESDVVCRFGGDEFVVVLANLPDPADAATLAKKVMQAVAPAVEGVAGRSIPVTLSMGISLYPDHASTPTKLIKLADKAMYKAKGDGKSKFIVHAG